MPDEKDLRQIIRFAMCMLNGLAILFVCTVLVSTIWRATRWHMGMELAVNLGHLPNRLLLTPLLATLGYVVLLIIGRLYNRTWMGDIGLSIMGCGEILSCLLIIFSLHMAYNGVLLLAVVDMLGFLQKRPRKFVLCGGILIYITTSLDSVRDFCGLIPFSQYLSYYSVTYSGIIQSMLTILDVLNLVAFIVYMVLMLSHKMAENDRINQLNSQLVTMNEQLKTYAAETERMTETRERNRLAREIHDTLGHSLTGIAAAADACTMMMDTSLTESKHLLKEIGDTARQGITEVRRSVNALRPDVLERENLGEALCAMAEHIINTTRVHVVMTLPEQEIQYLADEEDVIYRVVQEGITNAVRHGNATHVQVTLKLVGQTLSVIVKDNGTGIIGECKEDFGLKHMRERLALLNGKLEYDGRDGFTLCASIPIRQGGVKND